MGNISDRGFGGNSDNIAGATPGVALSQLAFGEWRGRSIYSGPAGCVIHSVHITPRDPTSAGPKFPTAGFFSLLGFTTPQPLDVNQVFITDATVLRNMTQDVFLSQTRQTAAVHDIVPQGGFIIGPDKYAHILCLTARDAANTNISTYYDLTVVGRYLAADSPYTLR